MPLISKYPTSDRGLNLYMKPGKGGKITVQPSKGQVSHTAYLQFHKFTFINSLYLFPLKLLDKFSSIAADWSSRSGQLDQLSLPNTCAHVF